jgi:hypothetical protein
MQIKIAEAQTRPEILRYFPVMRQLQTHFEEAKKFVE